MKRRRGREGEEIKEYRQGKEKGREKNKTKGRETREEGTMEREIGEEEE